MLRHDVDPSCVDWTKPIESQRLQYLQTDFHQDDTAARAVDDVSSEASSDVGDGDAHGSTPKSDHYYTSAYMAKPKAFLCLCGTEFHAEDDMQVALTQLSTSFRTKTTMVFRSTC